MALSGRITNDTSLKGREYYMDWTAVQNIAGNYSTVTVEHYLYNAPRYDLYISGRDNSCYVGGVYGGYTSAAISTAGNSTIHLGTTTHKIQHNADGTKSASITGIFYIMATLAGVYVDSVTATGTIELNRIPRGARITEAPNFNDEESPAITYVNDAGAMLTGLQAAITSADGATTYAAYRTIPTAGGTYTFNLTTAEREALRAACTSNSMPVMFRLKSTTTAGTFYNDALRTIAIVNATPDCTITARDINTATIALAGRGGLVRNASNIQYEVTAQGRKGATISKIVVSCGDEVKETASGVFYTARAGRLDFEVTDSRGNTNGGGFVWSNPVNYVVPTISGAVGRPTAAGVARLQAQGICFNGEFSPLNANACAVYWYDSTDGGATYGAAQALTVTRTGNNWEVDQQISGLDYHYPHTIKIEIVDSLNTRAAVLGTVSAIPVFYWNDGQFLHMTPISAPEIDAQVLKVAGEQVIDYIVASGTGGGWTWEKYASGRAECWGNFEFKTQWQAWGNWYITSNSWYGTFPFTFAELPTVSVTADAKYPCYPVTVIANQSNLFSTTRTGNYAVARTTSGVNNHVYTICCHVVGRWK